MKKTIVLTDGRAPRELIRALALRGWTTVELPAHPGLGAGVCSHTDMLIARIEKRIISLASYADAVPALFDDLYSLLAPHGFSFTLLGDEVTEKYPGDARLNALVMGDTVLYNPRSLSEGLADAYLAAGKRLVRVKQGYPACTVLPLGVGAAATADRGMAKALASEGIRVTLIEEGHILLPPYEYGFIGGCAGRLGDTVYFTGRIEDHPSYGAIKAAAEAEGLATESLTDLPLVDLGGLLFIEV